METNITTKPKSVHAPAVFQAYETTPNLGGTIVLVGCGGIGARVLPTLMKILTPTPEQAAQRDERTRLGGGPVGAGEWAVRLVDPDVVEERNCLRQPFVLEDVGRPKAEVLAERYGNEFVPIYTYVSKLEDVWGAHFNGMSPDRELAPHFARPLIFIGCVDNVPTRAFLRDQILFSGWRVTSQSLSYIDVGNDGDRGQIALVGRMGLSSSRSSRERHTIVRGDLEFPDVFTPRQEIEQDRPVAGGCSLAVDTQTPLTNNLAAALALGYINSLVQGRIIGSTGVRFSTLGSVMYVPGTLVRAAHLGSPYSEYGRDERAYLNYRASYGPVNEFIPQSRAQADRARRRKAKQGMETVESPILPTVDEAAV